MYMTLRLKLGYWAVLDHEARWGMGKELLYCMLVHAWS
jgi:hypothetical protein